MFDQHSVCVCAGRAETIPGGNSQEEDQAGQVSCSPAVLHVRHRNQQRAVASTWARLTGTED